MLMDAREAILESLRFKGSRLIFAFFQVAANKHFVTNIEGLDFQKKSSTL